MNRKNSSKKTTSQEPSITSSKSIFTRDLSPTEIESLRNDKKQASEKARRYFEKKFSPKKLL